MYDRDRPYPARLVDKRWLTSPGSERPTLHVALAVGEASFPIEPGDVVAVHVRNPPQLVAAVLARLGLAGDAGLAEALSAERSLGAPPLRLLRAALDQIEDEAEATLLEDLCDDDEALDAYLAEHDLLDVLVEHPTVGFDAEELRALLPRLQPRTYSVASSPRHHPGEVHLTVGIVRWTRAGRERVGVASAHFERLALGETLPLYHTVSRHFRLPDEDAPLICIGPGTGVAPFRGFLQERARRGGPAPWIFFGARHRAHDFYYQDELERGPLELAFSRDQPERVYVQHRLRERADEVVAWLERGAYLYLCGDASTMAPAVEGTLAEILSSRGHDGPAYLARLRDEKRFRRDVY
jgi:sulfite reductase (NADPH) flavoprotein alpha-component